MAEEVKAKTVTFPTGMNDQQFRLIIQAIREVFRPVSFATSRLGIGISLSKEDRIRVHFMDDAFEWLRGKMIERVWIGRPEQMPDKEAGWNLFWETVSEQIRFGPLVLGYPMATLLRVNDGGVEHCALAKRIKFDQSKPAGRSELLVESEAFIGSLLCCAARQAGQTEHIREGSDQAEQADRLIKLVDEWFPDAFIVPSEGSEILLPEYVGQRSDLVPGWLSGLVLDGRRS